MHASTLPWVATWFPHNRETGVPRALPRLLHAPRCHTESDSNGGTSTELSQNRCFSRRCSRVCGVRSKPHTPGAVRSCPGPDPGVCLGDNQTNVEGIPSQCGCRDALLKRMSPHFIHSHRGSITGVVVLQVSVIGMVVLRVSVTVVECYGEVLPWW